MVIITTVGTSLLTNLLNETELRKCFGKKIAVRKKDSISNGKATINELEQNNDLIRKFTTGSDKSCLFAKDDTYKINLNASAEIKSICKIAKGQPATVYLLTTDTDMSEFAAEKIKEALNGLNGLRVKDINRIKDLSIDNPNKFQQVGFINLINAIDDIYNKHKKDEIILNISGGYKALIPFLTIYGQIRNLSLMYIYEDSDELIEIPPMPLDFDFSFIEENYLAFEQIRPNKSIKNLPNKDEFIDSLAKKETDFKELKDKKIIEINKDNKVNLSLFGKLLFYKYEELYNSKIFSRQNLLGEVIEYKLYEYFKEKDNEVVKGKKIGNQNFEIDVFIGRGKINDNAYNEIEVIEVKPGGYIPIWKKKNDNNTIEYRLKDGSLKWIIENMEADKYIFNLIAYYHVNLHDRVVEQINQLYKSIKDENKNIELKLTLLKVPDNYKKNVNWKVEDKMLKILI